MTGGRVGGVTLWFARLRVPIGFVSAVVVLWLARPTGPSLVVGGAVAALGEALRVWASGHLNKSREVTASGPYRYLGHPLYVGSSIMGVGLGIASHSVVVAAVIAAYLAVTLTAAIRSEEALLEQKFGDRYRAFRGRGGDEGALDRTRRFSLTQAMANREYRTIVGLVIAVLLMILKASYNDSFWGAAAGR